MTKFIGRKNNQVSTNAQLGGMAFQDSSNAAVGNIDIESISGSPDVKGFDKNVYDTAVDVFVYDTSKDSDGGAWRKRTQHTSWYNETLNTATRGSRREFPAVAVIVAETKKVTIYDGDDPDLPMWMMFDAGEQTANGKMLEFWGTSTAGVVSSVSMLNGEMVVGTNNGSSNGIYVGVSGVNFISDSGYFRRNFNNQYILRGHNILERNSVITDFIALSGGLAGGNVNDVAMTVLPSAPIDDATGLPVPTIAVATDGGVSIIKDDESVVDLTNSQSGYGNCEFVDLVGDEVLLSFESPSISENARRFWIHSIPSSDTTVTSTVIAQGSADEFYKDYNTSFGGNALNYHLYPNYKTTNNVLLTSNDLYFGLEENLAIINRNKNSDGGKDGMLCDITTSFNTGWMHGDCKGAFLSDTDVTNAAPGSNLIPASSADFSSSSGWTLGTGWTISGGKLNKTTTANNTASYTVTGLTVGKAYTFSIDVDTVPSSGTIFFYALGEYTPWPTLTTTGTHSLTFVATSTSHAVGITGISGNGCVLDNASVTVGEADRSVNNRGLQVFGTVPKQVVATGADLVSYGPFNNNNNFRQPHNSHLRFEQNDFSIMFWVYDTGISQHCTLISKDEREFDISRLTSGKLRIYTRNSSEVLRAPDSSSNLPQNSWTCVCVVYTGGNTKRVYINGVLDRLITGTDGEYDIDSTTYGLNIGVRYTGGTKNYSADGVQLALMRISGSAPSPEQIKKIYEDEKHLFQENAKCTLYGSSDAVTALAYDEVTEQLHVGTSSGRSNFQGLRRINNTTTAVTTAISAHDGLIAQQ